MQDIKDTPLDHNTMIGQNAPIFEELLDEVGQLPTFDSYEDNPLQDPEHEYGQLPEYATSMRNAEEVSELATMMKLIDDAHPQTAKDFNARRPMDYSPYELGAKPKDTISA